MAVTGGGVSGQQILIGKVTGLFGVAGWVKVRSYTRPSRNITAYRAWRVMPGDNRDTPSAPVLEATHRHHGGVIAKFAGIDDRDAAAALLGCELTVAADELPDLPHDEYYWFQLIGLEVVNIEGRVLGVVRQLLETGAHDVLVVAGEGGDYLIPYVNGEYVKAVDPEHGRMRVDWQVEWRT